VSLEKYKSQGKAVEVTVNSKEENFKNFVSITSKNLSSVKREIGRIKQQQIGIIRFWGLVCVYF
jgi:hypothetical protein